MEKNIEIGLLYEFYGKLLTEKQSYILDSYYNNDLSLSEIAEDLEITRQGVRKHIKDAEKVLYNYEEKLELLKKYLKNKNELEQIYVKLSQLENKYNDKELTKLKNNINTLI